jgi:hypothetical protein
MTRVSPDAPPLIRPYSKGDRTALAKFLSFLRHWYPHADRWLDRRLDDLDSGKAGCSLASKNGLLGGVLIDVTKGRHVRKISTLYVAPVFARRGLGKSLIEARKAEWDRTNIDALYVTVATAKRDIIEPFLFGRDFQLIAQENGRYGCERDELIYRKENR